MVTTTAPIRGPLLPPNRGPDTIVMLMVAVLALAAVVVMLSADGDRSGVGRAVVPPPAPHVACAHTPPNAAC